MSTGHVFAVMRDGSEVEVARRHGDTVSVVLRSLTANTMLGSAAMLDDAVVETAEGGTVRYGDINTFVSR